jgi:hypothetical protein
MGLVDNFKDLFKLADAVNNLDLYKKLTELQTRAMELEEENRTLKDEIRTIREQQDISGRMIVNDNSYYVDDGKQLDGPFCMRCWDADRKLIRERKGATPGTHFCLNCRLTK